MENKGRNHFIIVDDEDAIRDFLRQFAERADSECDIYEAKNGEECYNRLRELSKNGSYGKIFMTVDHGMPNLTGLDMLRKVKDTGLAKKFGDKLMTYMIFSEHQDYGEEIGIAAVEEGLAKGYRIKPASGMEIAALSRKHFTA
ncbi:response regulator [Candidatus Pacearchaeota archaeon]|nr:response regulator [Candidatus Pacearchaeota archaeon]